MGWNNPLPIGQAQGAAPSESESRLGQAQKIVCPVAGPVRGHSSYTTGPWTSSHTTPTIIELPLSRKHHASYTSHPMARAAETSQHLRQWNDQNDYQAEDMVLCFFSVVLLDFLHYLSFLSRSKISVIHGFLRWKIGQTKKGFVRRLIEFSVILKCCA